MNPPTDPEIFSSNQTQLHPSNIDFTPNPHLHFIKLDDTMDTPDKKAPRPNQN